MGLHVGWRPVLTKFAAKAPRIRSFGMRWGRKARERRVLALRHPERRSTLSIRVTSGPRRRARSRSGLMMLTRLVVMREIASGRLEHHLRDGTLCVSQKELGLFMANVLDATHPGRC